MSIARLFIVAGPGHPYHGDGMQPQVLLSLYDDKAVWVLNDFNMGGIRRVHSSGDHLFDDAMLALALYAFRWLWEATPELPQAVQEVFGTDDLDTIEKKLTAGRPPAKAKMKKLYEASRLAWRKQRIVRLAAVQLASSVRRIGGLEVARMPKAFQCTMEDYGVLDWDIAAPQEFSGYSQFTQEIIRWSAEERRPSEETTQEKP